MSKITKERNKENGFVNYTVLCMFCVIYDMVFDISFYILSITKLWEQK